MTWDSGNFTDSMKIFLSWHSSVYVTAGGQTIFHKIATPRRKSRFMVRLSWYEISWQMLLRRDSKPKKVSSTNCGHEHRVGSRRAYDVNCIRVMSQSCARIQFTITWIFTSEIFTGKLFKMVIALIYNYNIYSSKYT